MVDPRDSSSNPIDDAILARYLSGVCSPAELTEIKRWLAADPRHHAQLSDLQRAWNPAPPPDADPEDRMWRWIAARMDAPVSEPVLLQAHRARPARRPLLGHSWRWGAIAAALVLGVGSALLWRVSSHSGPLPMAADFSGAPIRELVTVRGERATGHLPDGTRVLLGPDSRLRIAAAFAVDSSIRGYRDVYLEGEAFFEVTHDVRRPFRVHTASGVAEDLGTEFVVTAYPDVRATRVVVAAGKVELRALDGRAERLMLEAGDLGNVDAAGNARRERHVDVDKYVGWTRGQLVFDEVPIVEALNRLGRWYNVDIRLADTTLARRRLTASFHDDPITQVVRVLEVALDVRADHAGRVVVLRPLRAAAAPNP